MRLNVPFQSTGAPDPVFQLRAMFDDWAAGLEGRPDAVQSTAVFDPPLIPPNGTSTTTMTITLRDRAGDPIDVEIDALTVEHGAESAGRSTIGKVEAVGGGVFQVVMTAGTMPGVDRFTAVADDGVRPVTLTPEPRLEYFALGDLDGNGVVDTADLLIVLAEWGPCPDPPDPCPGDVNGDGVVDTEDLLAVLGNWG
jgi:hypothetical protein